MDLSTLVAKESRGVFSLLVDGLNRHEYPIYLNTPTIENFHEFIST